MRNWLNDIVGPSRSYPVSTAFRLPAPGTASDCHDVSGWFSDQAGVEAMPHVGVTGAFDVIPMLSCPSLMFDAAGRNDQRLICPRDCANERFGLVEVCILNFNTPVSATGHSLGSSRRDSHAEGGNSSTS